MIHLGVSLTGDISAMKYGLQEMTEFSLISNKMIPPTKEDVINWIVDYIILISILLEMHGQIDIGKTVDFFKIILFFFNVFSFACHNPIIHVLIFSLNINK